MRRLVKVFCGLVLGALGFHSSTVLAYERITQVNLSAPSLSLFYLHADYNFESRNNPAIDPIVPARLFIRGPVGPSVEQQELVIRFLEQVLSARRIDFSERVQWLSRDPLLERDFFANRNVLEISGLFPRVVRRFLGAFGSIDPVTDVGPNCFGAARAFYTNEDVQYVDEESFGQFLATLKPMKGPEVQFGDIDYFRELGHAVVLLFDGLIFQKPSVGVYHAYEIVRYEDMYKTFNSAIRMASNHRGGGTHDSPWDRFLTSISFMQEFPPPAPVGQPGDQGRRYRH